MSQVKHRRVDSMPAEPDMSTIYFVRNGGAFDMKVPDLDVHKDVGASPAGGMAGAPTFVQSSAPSGVSGPYLWWDTSGGNLTLKIEDGV